MLILIDNWSFERLCTGRYLPETQTGALLKFAASGNNRFRTYMTTPTKSKYIFYFLKAIVKPVGGYRVYTENVLV